MRVLFITRKFPPSTGGMENFAYDLYTSLQKKTSVKLIKWGGSNKFLPFVLPYFFVRAGFELIKGRTDIIHAHDGVVAVLGVVLSSIFRKPLTVVIHGLDITYPNRLYQWIVPRAISKADTVFCISRAAADEAVKRGVDIAKTVVIPLGITEDFPMAHQEASLALRKELDLSKEAKVLLTVGRLVKRKGVAWFIEHVLPSLASQFPDLVYVVVGEGEDRPAVEKAIATADLTEHIRLLGRVENKMMPLLYNGADVFVMPNIIVPGDMEGFGRVLLEASLYELPVVASGIEGIKDAITDGKNGVLVETQDSVAFETALAHFLKDRKQAAAFGKRSRVFTQEHFRWDAIADRYLRSYEKLLGKN